MQTIAVDRFIAAARVYCAAVEQYSDRPAESFLRSMQPKLAELYAAGLDLPDVDVTTTDLLRSGISNDEHAAQCLALSAYLDRYDMYWTMLDSPQFSDDDRGGIGTISSDLSETYRDVKSRLDHWDRGDNDDRRDALWELRFNFVFHYGDHMLDAMRAIHRFVLEGYL